MLKLKRSKISKLSQKKIFMELCLPNITERGGSYYSLFDPWKMQGLGRIACLWLYKHMQLSSEPSHFQIKKQRSKCRKKCIFLHRAVLHPSTKKLAGQFFWILFLLGFLNYLFSRSRTSTDLKSVLKYTQICVCFFEFHHSSTPPLHLLRLSLSSHRLLLWELPGCHLTKQQKYYRTNRCPIKVTFSVCNFAWVVLITCN